MTYPSQESQPCWAAGSATEVINDVCYISPFLFPCTVLFWVDSNSIKNEKRYNTLSPCLFILAFSPVSSPSACLHGDPQKLTIPPCGHSDTIFPTLYLLFHFSTIFEKHGICLYNLEGPGRLLHSNDLTSNLFPALSKTQRKARH